jgi:hypothetical protein
MLHEPHNAPLYVIMLSMPQRMIAPDHHKPKKGKMKQWVGVEDNSHVKKENSCQKANTYEEIRKTGE